MPIYHFKNNETKRVTERVMSFAEREEFLKLGTHTQMLSTPLIVSGVKSVHRMTDDGWKDTLRAIKSGSGKGNTVNV